MVLDITKGRTISLVAARRSKKGTGEEGTLVTPNGTVPLFIKERSTGRKYLPIFNRQPPESIASGASLGPRDLEKG